MSEAPLYLKIADLSVEIDGWDMPTGAMRRFFADGDAADRTPDLKLTFTHSEEEEDWLRLHRLLSEALIDRDVLLFHASAVALDGEGYAFTAPSGTGKSTHSALWKSCFGDRLSYVNDDKPFLVFRGNQVYVAGSPWMGKHGLGGNVTVPLRGIAVLKQAVENRISKLDPVEAYTALLQQVFLPPTRERTEKVLSLLERAVTGVPCYRLECTPDARAVETASAAMRRNRQ